MKIGNRTYTDKKEGGAALIDMCRSAKQPNMAVTIGEYQGFKMSVSFDSFFSKFTISLKGSLSHEVEIGADPFGNLQRLSNALEGMTGKMADVEQKLSNVGHQLETAKVEVTKPFAQEQELAEKLERLAELNALLNMDEKGDNALDMGDDEPEDENGEQSAQAQEVADVPRGRISVKEKLAQMREKAYGKKSLETSDISKEKRQKEIIM